MSRWERVEGLIECDVLCVAFFLGGREGHGEQ